ncbi:hypothetical protein BV898_18481 [Hypsibius exemplaris]|uniref:Uncharacterized protein n=1 Tax=Hypsibius exemplaris TaxID=2072580 RepID=A0A9X6NH04_HYPEX|nr:hypothetical protein BV898_18481 [Hypsibius exemplaris]
MPEKLMKTPSDPENDEVVPQSFLDMLEASKQRGDYVVFLYADGLVHKLAPKQLKRFYIQPRFSMLQSYAGKTYLETGMQVRLRWNKKFNRCEAEIMGVNTDPEKMDQLFSQLEQQRNSQEPTTFKGELREKCKVSVQEKADGVSKERRRLIEIHLGDNIADNDGLYEQEQKSEESDLINLDADSQVQLSQGHKKSDAEEPISSATIDTTHEQNADATLITGEPLGKSNRKRKRVSVVKEETEDVDLLKKKEARLLRKLKAVRERLPKKAKFSKLVVPEVSWSFLEEERQNDSAYCRLDKNSKICVDKTLLKVAQKAAIHANKYASLLMWSVIVTPEDLLKAQHVKTDQVGFAKLFGSANMVSVYAHVSRFRSQQIRDGASGKWLKELKAPKEIMAKWRISFYDRCKLI